MNTKNSKVKIRKMKISDLPSIQKIIQRTLSIVDAKKAIKDMADQSNNLYADGGNYVAEINKSVVGVIGYWKLGHHAKKAIWLDWFAVDKNYQNKGIGSKLFLYLITQIKKRGYEMLCIEKSSKDISAQFFYNKHGFVEFGRIGNYWEDSGDLVLLVKHL